MLTIDQLSELLLKHLQGVLTPEQQETLDIWVAESDNHREFFGSIHDEARLREQFLFFRPEVEAITEATILEKIRARKTAGVTTKHKEVHRVHFLKTTWFRYAAAILLIFGSVLYLYKTQQKEKTLTKTTQPLPAEKNIMPGGNKALLTLADGSTIVLDSAANGQLAMQEGSVIIKKDGRIIYDPNQEKGVAVTYNTMSTPRGGQYQLTLSDGTKVWLNAASSITYPTAFTANSRTVEIKGEAYFEVAKNPSKPFTVKTFKEEITVLGTSFNVNTYPEEPTGKISLVDGSVKVNKKILQPGQAYQDGNIIKTNLTQDIAWKNGVFNFDRMPMSAVARQLERWYDIEVRFEGNASKNELLIGKADRNLSLQDLLDGLTDDIISFRLEGRTLYVKSL